MFQILPNEIVGDILNFLPSRFLFDYRMMDLWHRVLHSSRLLPFSRNNQDDDDNSLFKKILFQRLNRKVFIWRGQQVSLVQMVVILVQICDDNFGGLIRYLADIYTLLGIPQEFLYLVENKLCMEKIMGNSELRYVTTENRDDEISIIESLFNSSGWSYQELCFIFELVSRNIFLGILDNETHAKSALCLCIEPIDISWTVVNDVTHSTHLESILQDFMMESQFLNFWNSVQPSTATTCVRMRGQIVLVDGKYRLDLYHPQFCSTLQSKGIFELGSGLFREMLRLLEGKPCHCAVIKELLLQRYWFPAMDGGSIFCESKSQRVLNSIGNYMGMTIEEKYHPFVRNYLSPYIFTTYNLDAPELSIYKYEMKISPTTRKLHFKIIPKSIPPFVISLTIILGTILFIQLNFGMFAWTKTRMFWNTELPLWKKIPLLGLGIFVETGISGIALTFLRHALSCAALSTFFSTLEYSADVKFTGS